MTQHVEEQDGKPSRKVYTITEAGLGEFHDLIASLPPELAVNEEEFLVRVGFFGEISPVERRSILSARAAVLDARIAQVTALLDGRQPVDDDDWPSRATGHFLLRLRSEREWIEQLKQKEGLGNDR